MIDLKKLTKRAKSIGDTEIIELPDFIKEHVEGCDESLAVVVVKDGVVQEVVLTDENYVDHDFSDAIEEHIERQKDFSVLKWVEVMNTKECVLGGVSVFVFGA